ncbi:DUF4065 domain-containing protein [Laribacter hongkongensis]|uniref:Panacea domain-containing protein n=1 Tax=Laribacter hongkongensis TaxID=168471 RepID=UPI001EFE1F96|nr:type II toxin-antitoxin system antitoxin SocA domain-containing protein [Laribacter hongkongensis]MCG9103792.1 DUF4065 domain-containing protein [Laribacter hongkongensis]MCG9113665.1 DUF4065 domain-containing protein [Laribacter hongkongensis]
MATVFDVARYILEQCGPMSAMKLQKLVYYAQAWSLVWDDRPIFGSRIEAWAHGPVVRELYDAHRGQFTVEATDFPRGDSSHLDTDGRDTIDAVLEGYGNRSAQWLSDQTHAEAPWQKARSGLSDSDRGDAEITLESMAEYYSAIS